MKTGLDEQVTYEQARKRVQMIRGFYIHATVYVLVNALLILLNLLTSPQVIWFIWPAFGWGIGLIAHGLAVSGFHGLWGEQWEQRKIKEIMEKMKSD
jgi:hypothetical protein